MHPRAIAFALLAPLLHVQAVTQAPNANTPPVSVQLRASWGAAEPLIEAIETVSIEDPTAFFPLISLLPISPDSPNVFSQHSKSLHTQIRTLATSLLSGQSLASYDALLALHAASPRIEGFKQYYISHVGDLSQSRVDGWTPGGEGCEAWVDWHGQILCDVSSLEDALSLPPPSDYKHQKLPFDHVYIPSPQDTMSDASMRSGSKPTAILYASLSAPNFGALHEALVGHSDASKLEYVLRWVFPLTSSTTDDGMGANLSGYGVSLDLKKMDYLALDDRHASSSSVPGDDANTKDKSQAEGQTDALFELLDSLPFLDASEFTKEKEAALTEDEIADLGFKAAQLIYTLSSNPDSQLSILRQLTQSFPIYASKLARKDLLASLNVSSPSTSPSKPSEEDMQTLRRPSGVLPALADEVSTNWGRVTPGLSLWWVNGRTLAEGEIGPFGLLRTMRKEHALVDALTALGMTRSEAFEVLVHDAHSVEWVAKPKAKGKEGKATGEGKEHVQEGGSRSSRWNDKNSKFDTQESTSLFDMLVPNDMTEGLVDASDRQEDGGVVVWWNDLGTDERYARYSSNLNVLLRPLYPGQMPTTRFNLFNVIAVLDLSQPRSLGFISTSLESIISRGWAVRWGIVPFVPKGEEQGDPTKMARAFYFLSQKYGMDILNGFLKRVAIAHSQIPTLSWPLVRKSWEDFGVPDDFEGITSGRLSWNQDGEGSIEKANTDQVDTLEKARQYARRVGITDAGGHVFVNGRYVAMSDAFMREMQGEMIQQLQYIQELVYTGILADSYIPSISTFFYDLPWTSKRRNAHIYPAEPSTSRTQAPGSSTRPLRVLSLPELNFKVGTGGFVVPDQEERLPVSMYVVADLDSEAGLALVKEALQFVDSSSTSRVTFVHNPVSLIPSTNSISSLFSTLISRNVVNSVPPSRLLRTLGPDESEPPTLKVDLLRELGIAEGDDERYAHYVRSCQALAGDLHLAPGEQAVLVNGRLVGPFEPLDFVAEDFEMLEAFEVRKRVGAVMTALEDVLGEKVVALDAVAYAHLVSMTSSILSAVQLPDSSQVGLFDAPPKPRSCRYKLLDASYTSFAIGDTNTALHHVAVVIDPLSETAQKWTSLLEWVLEFPDVHVEVYLVPSQHSEMPLKRFYRYNLASKLTYDEKGQEIPAQTVFNKLPIEPVYTLGVDVPSSWLVRPREALYDLDNIQLGGLSAEDRTSGLKATFALDYLVVDGHTREASLGNSPPRGLQLQLSTRDGEVVDDTQVVANLGYVQFKAKPGVYKLEIRPGRGREIYDMETVGSEGWDSPRVEEVGSDIAAISFEGLTLYPRFVRKHGMATADVLEALSGKQVKEHGVVESIMSKVSTFFTHKEEKSLQLQAGAQADINIFTVASGLLYERFASIMILSVLRNTNSTVKFWFIENFLSPSFLEFIPHFAEAYNFQYELVTYKWPSWLRAQKEKQRIIWAYKILFLDVLFPMDLKKVIFVDADQIVRADLQELVDLDIHGAPYAYTPMGDDNHDMEGFRFWKTGYWAEFLRGLPYHISALYVVDLARFRQIAAGDILRGQYQALSADPNSLANLDQDLPNNIQHQVPIYSLHEDWLWCETWCSKDRLHRAKTIDLCQNPLTKEPKLARARQIPEWEVYDGEIAQFAQKLAEEGKIRASAATADTTVLANVGAAPPQAVDPAKEKEGTNEEVESHLRDEL